MDTSELKVIYSPGTNNLIKWRFRLKRKHGGKNACHETCIRWYLRTELISTIVGLLILCSKNMLAL